MKKILISDNIARFMKSQRTILSRSDLGILTARSAEEMLRLHGEEGADLIITELDIPEMGGDSLCNIVRDTPGLRNVSIIIIHPDTPEAVDRCNTCNVNAHIPTPLNPDIVSNRIQELLDIKVRESMRILMKVSVEGKFDNDYFFAHSQNISGTGILLESDISLQVGNSITCSFFLQGEQLSLTGVVMRVIVVSKNLYQYGVKFTGIDRSLQQKIEEFVQHRQDNKD